MSDMRWSTGEELIELLAEQNALVDGMTIEEAADALGFTETESGLYVKTVVTTKNPVSTGTTASEAVIGITAVSTVATNLTLYETLSGIAVGGLGSVALPIAIGMGASAGGYLIGTELYEDNQEFMDNLLSPVYDFIASTGSTLGSSITDELDVPTIPMIIDRFGKTYMDLRFNTTLKNFLDAKSLELPISTVAGVTGLNLTTPTYKITMLPGVLTNLTKTTYRNQPSEENVTLTSSTAPVYLVYLLSTVPKYQSLIHYNVFLSEQQFTVQYSGHYGGTVTGTAKTINGKTFYVNQFGFGNQLDPTYYTPYVYNIPMTRFASDVYFDLTAAQAYTMLYGVAVQTAGFPSTIERYVPGTNPQPLKKPAWNPVVVPGIVPGVMPVPEPIPPEEPEPDPKKLTPFIPSKQPQPGDFPVVKPVKPPGYIPSFPPVPKPDPTPDTSTKPSPEPDPSTDPSQNPGTPTNPSTPEVPIPKIEPTDNGNTPTPVLPVVPNISSSATGLLHVYNPTNDQINQFGSWLWTTFSGDLLETLSKLFNSPMDAVIGLHEIYSTPVTSSSTTIKAGYLDSGVASQLVSQRYTEIKCGAVGVPEYWGNYLDYAPYTKVFCYLPFIGIVELNTDDIVGSGVEITYKIDTYNGSCIAMITTAKPDSTESVTYEFSGNCAVEIPITSGMKSAIQNGLIGAATTALGAATLGVGGIGAAAIVGGARSAASSKNMVQHSGSFGSSYGAMGIKTPYLIIKRPKQKVVPGYNDNYGYPAHKMVLISTCSGYLKAIEVDVISPTATEDEKKLIEKELKNGIFVN